MPESINEVKFKGSNATDFSDIKQLKLKFNETKTVYAWNKPYTLTVDTTELNNPVNKTNVPSYNIIRANTYEPLVTGREVLDKVNINQTLIQGSASNLTTSRKELPIYHGDEIKFNNVSSGDTAHYDYNNLPSSTYSVSGNITIKPSQTLKTFTITVNNTEHSYSIIERPENNSPYGHGGVMGGCMSSASVFAGDNIYVFLRAKEGYNITSTENYLFNDVTSNKTVNVTTEERSGTLTIKKYVDDAAISSLGSEQFFTYSGNITRDNNTKTSFTNNASDTWTYSNGVKYWDRYSVSVDSINSNIVSMVTDSSSSGNITDNTTITLKAQRKMGTFNIMKSGVVLTDGTSVVQSSGSYTDFNKYGSISNVELTNNLKGGNYSSTSEATDRYQSSIYALDSFSVSGSANTGYQYLGLSTSSGSQSISYSPGASYTYPDARTSTFYPVFKVNTYSGVYYNRSDFNSAVISSYTYSATYNSTRTISPSSITGFTFANKISYYVNEGDAQATTVIGSSATFTVRAVNGKGNNYVMYYTPNTYSLGVSTYTTNDYDSNLSNLLYGWNVAGCYNFYTASIYRSSSPYSNGSVYPSESSKIGTISFKIVQTGSNSHNFGTTFSGANLSQDSLYYKDRVKIIRTLTSGYSTYFEIHRAKQTEEITIDSNKLIYATSGQGNNGYGNYWLPRLRHYPTTAPKIDHDYKYSNDTSTPMIFTSANTKVFFYRCLSNSKFPKLEFGASSVSSTLNSLSARILATIYNEPSVAGEYVTGLFSMTTDSNNKFVTYDDGYISPHAYPVKDDNCGIVLLAKATGANTSTDSETIYVKTDINSIAQKYSSTASRLSGNSRYHYVVIPSTVISFKAGVSIGYMHVVAEKLNL